MSDESTPARKRRALPATAIGERIATALNGFAAARGLNTQTEIAAALGTNPSRLYKYTHGQSIPKALRIWLEHLQPFDDGATTAPRRKVRRSHTATPAD